MSGSACETSSRAGTTSWNLPNWSTTQKLSEILRLFCKNDRKNELTHIQILFNYLLWFMKFSFPVTNYVDVSPFESKQQANLQTIWVFS